MGFIVFFVMSAIISFFKWIGEAVVKFFTWIAGVPSLVIAAVTGLWTSVQSLVNSLTVGGTVVTDALEHVNNAASGLSSALSSAPSVVQLGMYALSMDVLFTYVYSVSSVFFLLVVGVLTLFVVSIPAFLIQLYAIKMTAWLLSIMLPKGWVLSGISDLASLDVAHPVREALKDGKYNPWLSS